jgi:hypothetical protein
METTERIAAATELGEHHAGVLKVTHNFLDRGKLEGRQTQAIFKSRNKLNLSLGPNSKALG